MAAPFISTGLKRNLDIQDDVYYLVRNLEKFDQDKAVRSGLASGINVYKAGGRIRLRKELLNNAKTKLGRNTGNLMGSFKSFVYRVKPGAMVGFRRGLGGGNHAHLVDRGTRLRPHPKTSNSGWMYNTIGKSAKNGVQFWTNTFDQDSPKAYSRLLAGVGRAVNRINSKQ